MPNTGTPAANSAASIDGAPWAYTLLGHPESTTATGSLASISATGIVEATISEYTRASRTRRAISWAYWAPKSTTRTGRGFVTGEAYAGTVTGRIAARSVVSTPAYILAAPGDAEVDRQTQGTGRMVRDDRVLGLHRGDTRR